MNRRCLWPVLMVVVVIPMGNAGAETEVGLRGIDVSQFQGEIDWQAVKASGVVFAFARALEGETIHDAQFAANWEGLRQAGVVRGAYHFYVANDSPAAQAEVFSSLVTLEPGDLAPMVDIESASVDAAAPRDLVANVRRFLALIETYYGVKPIIYTDAGFWNQHMDATFGAYPLWVADFDVDRPTLPNGWDDWVLWQHSPEGTVPGVAGAVDLDTFNGELQDLALYRIPEPVD